MEYKQLSTHVSWEKNKNFVLSVLKSNHVKQKIAFQQLKKKKKS